MQLKNFPGIVTKLVSIPNLTIYNKNVTKVCDYFHINMSFLLINDQLYFFLFFLRLVSCWLSVYTILHIQLLEDRLSG